MASAVSSRLALTSRHRRVRAHVCASPAIACHPKLGVALGHGGFDTALAASMSKRKKRSESARPQAPPVSPWEARYHPQARAEADAILERERKAIDNAVDKLVSLGPMLPFPCI